MRLGGGGGTEMCSSMGMMSIKPQFFKRFEWPKINRLRGKTPLALACHNAVLKPGFDFGHIWDLSSPKLLKTDDTFLDFDVFSLMEEKKCPKNNICL